MKIHKIFGTFLAFLFLIKCTTAVAQVDTDFESYKKARQQSMLQMQKQQEHGIDSLRKAQNNAFLEMLKKEWEYISIAKGNLTYKQPKPPTPPSITKEDIETPKPIIEYPKDEPQDVSLEDEEIAEEGILSFSDFNFFNATIKGPIIKAWPIFQGDKIIEQKIITDYWQACSEAKALESLLKFIDKQKSTLSLNDWSIILLVRDMAKSNFENKNAQVAFEWFLLIQLNFDVRLTFDSNSLYIAYPIQEKVYANDYFIFNNKPYYLINSNHNKKLYTYQGQFETAKNFPTFSNLTKVKLPKVYGNRTFEFSWLNKKYLIQIPFNQSAIHLYQTVPQLDLAYYFNEAASNDFNQSLSIALKPYLDSIVDIADKVRFLHSLILLSIPYQTDDDQFGIEKFCLAEEVLFYPYADCEDRTFLLNHMIKTLLGLRTIGLHLPGHMSMAVELPYPEKYSATFYYKGRSYIYCDPTFFGADIGILPNEYKGVKAEIIE